MLRNEKLSEIFMQKYPDDDKDELMQDSINHKSDCLNKLSKIEIPIEELVEDAASADEGINNTTLPLPQENTIDVVGELLSLNREDAIELLRQNNNQLSNILNAIYF